MDSQTIIKKIIEILDKERLITITDLSKKINCNWSTTKHNCEIVEICNYGYLYQYKNKLFVLKK